MAENPLDPVDDTVSLDPFTLHYADSLPDAKMAFRLMGNAQGPVIAVLGGISAHRIVTGAPGEGWWPEMVGPGLAWIPASIGFWVSTISAAGETVRPRPTAVDFRPSARTIRPAL